MCLHETPVHGNPAAFQRPPGMVTSRAFWCQSESRILGTFRSEKTIWPLPDRGIAFDLRERRANRECPEFRTQARVNNRFASRNDFRGLQPKILMQAPGASRL